MAGRAADLQTQDCTSRASPGTRVELTLVVVDEKALVCDAVIANRVDGIFVAPGVTQIVVEKTNIYGNGMLEGLPLNCGPDARNNFRGASSGPGADPADDSGGGNVNVVPFAAREFKVPDAND